MGDIKVDQFNFRAQFRHMWTLLKNNYDNCKPYKKDDLEILLEPFMLLN